MVSVGFEIHRIVKGEWVKTDKSPDELYYSTLGDISFRFVKDVSIHNGLEDGNPPGLISPLPERLQWYNDHPHRQKREIIMRKNSPEKILSWIRSGFTETIEE